MADVDLAARWRRLRARLKALAAAENDSDPCRCPDEAVWALHSFNDLYQIWWEASKKPGKGPSEILAGDPAGETVRALIYVRGGATHNWLQYGPGAAMEDVYIDTYTELYTPWVWRPFVDTKKPDDLAASWYARDVAWHGVMEPFAIAVPWLEAQSALRL